MLKIFTIFLLLFSFIKADKPLLKLAPLPMSSAEKTTKIFSPFARYVSSILGQKVELTHFTNYDDILKALRENRIDLAYLGPLPYTSYRLKSKNAFPLVGFLESDGTKGYHCVLIGSKIDKIDFKNIKGKKVALTQPLSTCGYFLTSKLIKQVSKISIKQMKYRYLKKHTKVALSVARGEYLLGGVKDSVARDYQSLGLTVFDISKSLPSFILVANSNTLDKKSIINLQKQLLKTPKEIFEKWGKKISHGLYKVNENDFNAIEKRLKNMKIPQKGNF